MLKFSIAILSTTSVFWMIPAAAAPPYASASATAQGRELLGKLPLRFEANEGQWAEEIRFAARSAEQSVAFTDAGAVVWLENGAKVSITTVGGNRAARPEPAGKLASGSSYFFGQDRSKWQGNVAHYSNVAYRGVYPGVDLVYKGAGKKLEYDFVVAPQADASRIRLRFDGADELRIDEKNGELVIRAAGGGGELRQPLPFAFQERGGQREQVTARYKLFGKNEAGFELGAYDAARELTIDPVLVATYFGGDNVDVATAVTVDRQGRVWVTGYTSSATLPLSDRPYADTRAGGADLFIVTFNPDVSGADSLVWSTYLGGDGADRPTAMAVTSDFIYIVGDTMSSNFPLGGGPVQTSRKGDTDAFLIQISRTQQGLDAFWYGTYFGGDQRDYATAIAVDANSRIYMAGYGTFGDGFTYAGGSLQAANRGGYDAFFAVFQPGAANALIYSTFLGGARTDVATGIAVDAAGLVHLTGYTLSEDFPATGGAYRTTYAGRGDIFYARADIRRQGLDGLLYATYIGGSDTDFSYAMTADAQGRLYLTGYTFSPDFPVAGNAFRTEKAGAADVFVMRLDPAATPVSALINYATYLGGAGSELAYGIALDTATGRVAVTGYTDSTDFPAVGGALQARNGGALDGFLALVDMNATPSRLVYSSYVGGDSPDVGYHVTADTRGNFYMVGSTTSRRLGSPNVFQPDLSRYTDGFLVRFNLCENVAACQAQGLINNSSSPALPATAAAADACAAPGPLTLTLDGATCAAAAEGNGGGTVLCSRKVCSDLPVVE